MGQRITEEFLDGEPVVLFAYGLSGSGKTYTVFGPDAVDAPEASLLSLVYSLSCFLMCR